MEKQYFENKYGRFEIIERDKYRYDFCESCLLFDKCLMKDNTDEISYEIKCERYSNMFDKF